MIYFISYRIEYKIKPRYIPPLFPYKRSSFDRYTIIAGTFFITCSYNHIKHQSIIVSHAPILEGDQLSPAEVFMEPRI